jgi:hypothetical protein
MSEKKGSLLRRLPPGNILVTRGIAPELRHASGLHGLRNLGNTPLKRDQLGLLFGTLLTISTLQL